MVLRRLIAFISCRQPTIRCCITISLHRQAPPMRTDTNLGRHLPRHMRAVTRGHLWLMLPIIHPILHIHILCLESHTLRKRPVNRIGGNLVNRERLQVIFANPWLATTQSLLYEVGIDLTLKEHQIVEAVSEIKLGLFGMSAERRQYMWPMAVESCS